MTSTDATPPYKNPILWVPTTYFAEGIVYTMVTSAANVLFANMGLSNEKAALYSSLTGFAYSFKSLWGPLLEMFRTKKFFVVATQATLALTFAGIALSLKAPGWLYPVMGLLLVSALAGATQDIGTDGVYITTLDLKRQSAFSGFQSLCWNLGPIIAQGALFILVGKLAGESDVPGAPAPPIASYQSAWMITYLIVAAGLAGLAVWHLFVAPAGAKATDAPKTAREAAATFQKAFVSFFQKDGILVMLGFAFFYRVGLGLLEKIAPLFLIGTRESGGLGLSTSILGKLNMIATFAMMVGSILGGLFVARRGLRRSLLILSLALNVPNVTFLFLGLIRPEAGLTASGLPDGGYLLIGSIFCIEKLGWGFGSVGHMIYMMQQIAPGPYRTAHYAIATGIGLSLCMTLTGMVSGYLQTSVGYTTYFAIVLFMAIPSILFAKLAPFHQPDTSSAQ